MDDDDEEEEEERRMDKDDFEGVCIANEEQ
jgi:hypothetical protein